MDQRVAAVVDSDTATASPIWDVWIVLDRREVRGRPDRQFFERQLVQNGCRCVARNLVLGDFLWIARQRDPHLITAPVASTTLLHVRNQPNSRIRPTNTSLPLDGSDDNNNGSDDQDDLTNPNAGDVLLSRADHEVVLDYIVERKCMDDLIASIKDGRFKDQKLRLTACGLANKIYLVEEARLMRSQAFQAFGPDRVRSALAQTQVHHGFFVKQTASIDDTVVYLTQMTRLLDAAVKRMGPNLHPIQLSQVTKATFSDVRISMQRRLSTPNATAICLPTFDTFQALNWRTRDYTVRDMWIRQLMAIRGVSLDKAIQIAGRYPTFQSLMIAYSNCISQYERENLLVNTVSGHGRRSIPVKLSKRCAILFGEQHSYPVEET